MAGVSSERRPRRRAGLTLSAIVIVFALIAVVVIAHFTTAPAPPESKDGVPQSSMAAPPTGSDHVSEQNALATRPMLRLPAQAAQPQAMTSLTAGPEILVPPPTITTGRWIPDGFPSTPEGALGQLKALDESALATVDPQVYSGAYRDLAQLGAPDPGSTGLASLLSSLRSRANLPATGPVTGLSANYQVTHGQIKGTTADGSYTVVCVLGQFSVGVNGQTVSAGIGDCQAMRWIGSTWRIASGAQAAPAPSAWPGSADAVKAGYRELS